MCSMKSRTSPTRAWLDFVFRIHWSRQGNSSIDAFLGGQKIFRFDGPLGYRNEIKGPYFKLGVYASGEIGSPLVAYHDNYSRADSFEAVDPSVARRTCGQSMSPPGLQERSPSFRFPAKSRTLLPRNGGFAAILVLGADWPWPAAFAFGQDCRGRPRQAGRRGMDDRACAGGGGRGRRFRTRRTWPRSLRRDLRGSARARQQRGGVEAQPAGVRHGGEIASRPAQLVDAGRTSGADELAAQTIERGLRQRAVKTGSSTICSISGATHGA